MSELLALTDVTFSYGHVQVLFGVSLEVQKGEALALLGTNGAGKSTLLRVLTGLEHPSGGNITLDGHDITRVEAEDLVGRGIVLVPGGRGVFPDMTVRDNLEVQAFLHRRSRLDVRARIDRAVAVFPRLQERFNSQAGSLSGGEQQQLALAKALVLDPVLLCIDELSLGLAPVVVAELMEIVEEIRRAGVSMLLVEQSLNIAASMCQRAVFMEKGAIRFEGATADLLERDDIARAVFLGDAGQTAKPPRVARTSA